MNKQGETPTYPVTADYIISLGNDFEEVFATSGKKGCVVAKGTDAAMVIQGCICSGHDHVVVDDSGQQHGINIKDEVLNIVVNGNATYGNRAEPILDETERAVVVNKYDG